MRADGVCNPDDYFEAHGGPVVLQLLTTLEIKGFVKSLPGGLLFEDSLSKAENLQRGNKI